MTKYKELDENLVRAHYQRPEIRQIILETSQDKEVVGSYGGVGYGKRPDLLVYEDDILSLVKSGVTSFHASEELWEDPLAIGTHLSRVELSQLRKGWDLILDIDCKVLRYSQIAADLVIKRLKHYGITGISCKFSGNHGFHIAVAWESFPKQFNGTETRLLFPEAPRHIAELLSYEIRSELAKNLIAAVEMPDLADESMRNDKAVIELAKQVGKNFTDVLEQSERGTVFNPFTIVDIDTILITSRHLYRQVYSLNEKSGLVSIPINPEKVLLFDPKIAQIESQVLSRFTFLSRSVTANEGALLLQHAYDYVSHKNRKYEEELESQAQEFAVATEKIPDVCFPPHIKAMLGKIKDGKKRALFILSNFLRCCGYSNPEIELRLKQWNDAQDEPLRDSYFQGQLSHFKRSTTPIPPQNFSNSIYVDILGEFDFSSDKLLPKVRNPVAYAMIRHSMSKELAQKERKPKKTVTAKTKKGEDNNSDAPVVVDDSRVTDTHSEK